MALPRRLIMLQTLADAARSGSFPLASAKPWQERALLVQRQRVVIMKPLIMRPKPIIRFQ